MSTVVWYARSGVVLSVLLILVLLTALFVKTPVTGRDGDPRLLSTSTEPLGAALFHDLAKRLGFTVKRALSPSVGFEARAIITELNPIEVLTPADVHLLLQHVRSGGALLTVLGQSTAALSDSLRITVDPIGRATESQVGSTRQCEQAITFTRTGLWFGPPVLFALRLRGSLNPAQRTFIVVKGVDRRARPEQLRPAMIGVPLGQGRIVIASDPDILRNDALRDCSFGLDVAVVAALQYLREGGAGPRTTMVFNDFRSLRSTATGVTGVVQAYLVNTASGRVFFQIGAAGLLLLLAMAPRVLPPPHNRPLERRSPLEHVDALARAYAQVGATRTGTMRLVRGLERRVGATGRGQTPQQDDLFLARVAESTPSLAADVALVRQGLVQSVNTAQFTEVGKAIARIEHALTHT